MVVEESKLKIADFMQIMDIVDSLKKRERDVQKQFNLDDQKVEIAQKLKEAYNSMGQDVDDAQVNTAVDQYFSSLYEFEEPPKNFIYKLANLYVGRERIAHKYGKPILISLSSLAVLGMLTKGGVLLSEKISEKNVEQIVEADYKRKQLLEEKVKEISSYPLVKQLPKSENDVLSTDIKFSGSKLNDLNNFFNKYCSDGTAEDDVNQENYKNVRANLPALENELNTIESRLGNANTIVDTQKGINELRQNFDYTMKEISNTKPQSPKKLIERADVLYKGGINSLDSRKLNEAQKYLEQIVSLEDNIKEFIVLPEQIKQLYASIRSMAKEEDVIKLDEDLYKQAGIFTERVEIQQLKQVLNELISLEDKINEGYSVIITGGKWRYPNDNKSARNYYLIVQARNAENKILYRRVKNEEDGRTEEVREWGERVPEGAYEKVKGDKQDNGIIENNLYSEKLKGYVNESVKFKDNNGQTLRKIGQITKW